MAGTINYVLKLESDFLNSLQENSQCNFSLIFIHLFYIHTYRYCVYINVLHTHIYFSEHVMLPYLAVHMYYRIRNIDPFVRLDY